MNVKLDGRTRWVFLDVKQDEEGGRFLSISEVAKENDAGRHRVIIDEADIQDFKRAIDAISVFLGQGTKGRSLAERRAGFPRAYEAWSPEEEIRLKSEYQAGCTIGDLARTLGRNQGAIISRLRRMGLNPDDRT